MTESGRQQQISVVIKSCIAFHMVAELQHHDTYLRIPLHIASREEVFLHVLVRLEVFKLNYRLVARLDVSRFETHGLPFVALFVDQLNIGKFAGFAQLAAFIIKLRLDCNKVFFQDPTRAPGITTVGFHIVIFGNRFRHPARFAITGVILEDFMIPFGWLVAYDIAI